MSLEYSHVDVFSRIPFGGNSLPVFPDAADLTAEQMLRITQEMRHFEAIFLQPTGRARHRRGQDLRPVRGTAIRRTPDHRGGGGSAHALGARLARSAGGFNYPARQSKSRRRSPAEAIRAGWTRAPRSSLARSMTALGSRAPSTSRRTISTPTYRMEVVSTGLRYLIVPVRPGALARARISRDITELVHGAGAQFAVLLDESAVEVRHWNNDGIIEDVATGSAAGTIGAYRLRHGLGARRRHIRSAPGPIHRPPKRTARAAGRRSEPRRNGECRRRCLLRRTRHDRGPSVTERSVIDAETIRASVGFEDLIEPVSRAFAESSAGLADNGMVVMFPAQRRELGDVYVKTGTLRGHDVYIVKVSPWFSRNAERGQPQGGFVGVFDSAHRANARAAERRALSVRHPDRRGRRSRRANARDVERRYRCGARRRRAGLLAAVGALSRTPVPNPVDLGAQPGEGRALKTRLSEKLPDVEIRFSSDIERTVRSADVLITATQAREPLVRGEWLRPGAHITAVGADDATKCELDATALRRARGLRRHAAHRRGQR